MIELKVQHKNHKKPPQKHQQQQPKQYLYQQIANKNNIISNQQKNKKKNNKLSQQQLILSLSSSQQQFSLQNYNLLNNKQQQISETFSITLNKYQKNRLKKEQRRRIKNQQKKKNKDIIQDYYKYANLSKVLFPELIQSQQNSFISYKDIAFVITRDMRLIQDRIYFSQVSNAIMYLQRHKEQIKDQLRLQGLQEMFADIHQDIISDIWDGEYQVNTKIIKYKEQRQKIDQMRDKLQNKITDLRSSLDMSNVKDTKNSLINVDSELMVEMEDQQKNQKIKKQKASSFIKKIVQEKKQLQRKKLQRQLSEQKRRQEQQKIKEQQSQKIKKDKHQKIRQRHQKARNVKQVQIKQARQRKKQFQKFFSQYKNKVPLYKQIEKRYMNKVTDKELSRMDAALNKIRQERKPLNISQMIQHQNWYQKMKKQNQERRSLQMKQQIQRRKAQSIAYYKGQSHSFVDDQINKAKYGQIYQYQSKLMKKRKQNNYMNQIVSKYKPKPSLAKKRQLQELQQKRKWSQKWRLQAQQKQGNRYQEGKKNMQALKQYNKNMRQQGKIVIKTQRTTKTSKTLQPRPNYKNYLQQIRQEKYLKNGKSNNRYSSQLNYHSLLQKDPVSFANKLSKLQQVNKRKQQYIRQITHLPIQTYLFQRTSLNQNYLETARAKLALLNELN